MGVQNVGTKAPHYRAETCDRPRIAISRHPQTRNFYAGLNQRLPPVLFILEVGNFDAGTPIDLATRQLYDMRFGTAADYAGNDM
jgi:hypothetical protein